MNVVQATHRIMREQGTGDQLPPDDLAFFLEVCSNNVLPADIGEEVMVQEVKRALEMVELHGRHKTR